MATVLAGIQGRGSCSEKTQATVPTAAIGTQCAFKFVTSNAAVQTSGKFRVPKVDGTRAGTPFKRRSASRGGTSKTSEASKKRQRTCTCASRKLANDSKRTQHRGKHFSCQYCRQLSHLKTTLPVQSGVDARKKPYICTVCKKGFRKKSNLRTHMALHTGCQEGSTAKKNCA